MIVHEEKRGDTVVLTPEGALGEAPLKEFEESVGKFEKGKVVIDLSRLTHINSQGVSFLLNVWRRFTRAKGRLVIAGARGQVAEVFAVTRINTFVPMADDTAQAIARLEHSAEA